MYCVGVLGHPDATNGDSRSAGLCCTDSPHKSQTAAGDAQRRAAAAAAGHFAAMPESHCISADAGAD